MKLFFIGSAFYILFLMKVRFRATWDPALDTFRVELLVGGAALLALLIHSKFTFAEVRLTKLGRVACQRICVRNALAHAHIAV